MLAELEEQNRKRLMDAALTELGRNDDVLEVNQSLREAPSEHSAHSQSVESVRLTNCVTNAWIEVANQFTQLQDSAVDLETRGAQGGLPWNPYFTSAGVPKMLQNNREQYFPPTARGRPKSPTVIPSNVATDIGRANTTPPFVIVSNWTNSKQLSLNNAPYFVQLNATH